GWTQRKVENAVDVTPEGQSSIVDITASDTSANGSAHVANVFVKAVTDARKATLAPLVDRAVATTRAQLSHLAPNAPSLQTLSQRIRDLENVRDTDPTISISQVAAPPPSASGISLPLVFIL